MLFTELGIVIEVRLEQPEKVYSSIVVADFGIVTEVRLEQPWKALPPILVTDSGMVIDLSPEQSENVPSSILVTPSRIVIDVSLDLRGKELSFIHFIPVIPIVADVISEHHWKAHFPICVTELGIVIDVRL